MNAGAEAKAEGKVDISKKFSPGGALRALAASGLFSIGVLIATSGLAQDKTIKIGILTFVSGSEAAEGQEQVRGAEMAIEEANAAGGVAGYTLELVVGDVRQQSSEAVVSAFERLSGDPDVQVILGSYASTTNFEIEYMAEANMLYLIGGNADQTREIIEPDPDRFPTVWSLAPSYEPYGTAPPHWFDAMGKEGAYVLNNKKVAIVASDNPWSMSMYVGMKEEFAKLGWTISVDEVVPASEISDWRPILNKIRQDPPDVIINTDYLVNNAASFQNQFMEDPTPSLMVNVYAPSIPEFRTLTKEKSDGILADILMHPVEGDPWAEFQAKFQERYGVQTGSQGAVMYELVQLYLDALAIVKDPADRLAMGKAVSEIEKDTMFGHLVFDPKTHLAQQGEEFLPIQFFQVWDGDIKPIWPEKYATADFRRPPWME
jgi:branched-chain amino acid transport system substrate-binding protein